MLLVWFPIGFAMANLDGHAGTTGGLKHWTRRWEGQALVLKSMQIVQMLASLAMLATMGMVDLQPNTGKDW